LRTRAQELRARDRWVLSWSLLAAVVIHGLVFTYWLTRPEPVPRGEGIGLSPEDRTPSAGIRLDLFFGPPDIEAPDGTMWKEGPERFLTARRVVQLSSFCDGLTEDGRTPVTGVVRLRLDGTGRVERVDVADGTGDPCGNAAMTAVASDLLYRWLPSERFPAPVELLQPVTITDARP
jgi:hypothetical protein